MQNTLKQSEAGYLFLELIASLLLIITVISVYVTQNLKQQHQLSKAAVLREKRDIQEIKIIPRSCTKEIDHFEVSRILCKNNDSQILFLEEMP